MQRMTYTWIKLTACLLFAAAMPVGAAEIGKVSELVGLADVSRRAAPPVNLKPNDAIHRQDIIRTKKDSKLVVIMKDGSRLTLGESSRLVVSDYVSDAEPAGLLELTRGRLRAFVSNVFGDRKDSFKVRTKTAVVGVQGTEFIVAAQVDSTFIGVIHGLVGVWNADPAVSGRQTLGAGQSTVVKKGKPPQPPRKWRDSGPGSGGDQDRISGGEQGDDPRQIRPVRPSSDATPPRVNPPKR